MARRESDPLAAEQAILAALDAEPQAHSIAPEAAARRLTAEGEDWHRHLPAVKAAARRLAEGGRITLLRHGKPVAPAAMRGVVRLGRGPR